METVVILSKSIIFLQNVPWSSAGAADARAG